MSESEFATEETIAEDLERSFQSLGNAGEKSGSPASSEEESSVTNAKYEFDDDYQFKILAFIMRDRTFHQLTDGLIKPDYFESITHQVLAHITIEHWKNYANIPDLTIYRKLIVDAVNNNLLRKDLIGDVQNIFNNVYKEDISNRDFIVDSVEEFAKHQAWSNFILNSVTLVDKGDFTKIESEYRKVGEAAANRGFEPTDYFKDIEKRTQYREDIKSGKIKPNVIATGITALDNLLYNGGLGRKEVTMIMGGPKSGKSTAMADIGLNVSLQGKNVLIVTLELCKQIYEDRLDANLSENLMSSLGKNIYDIDSKIKAAQKRAGTVCIHEFPSGRFTPNNLQRIVEKYKTKKDPVVFDMIILDYLDLMRPNTQTRDKIEDSKQMTTDIRAIAQIEDVALLTATASNREGIKSMVTKTEHIADDINKARIVDLLISINMTDEEKLRNEARLYFAASRNSAGDFSVRVLRDPERMKFIKKVLEIC